MNSDSTSGQFPKPLDDKKVHSKPPRPPLVKCHVHESIFENSKVCTPAEKEFLTSFCSPITHNRYLYDKHIETARKHLHPSLLVPPTRDGNKDDKTGIRELAPTHVTILFSGMTKLMISLPSEYICYIYTNSTLLYLFLALLVPLYYHSSPQFCRYY
jgi:hypothetical protein